MNKEIKIGKIGMIDGVKVRCLKAEDGFCGPDRKGATDCYFIDKCDCVDIMCEWDEREDQENVYYLGLKRMCKSPCNCCDEMVVAQGDWTDDEGMGAIVYPDGRGLSIGYYANNLNYCPWCG